MNDLIQVSFGDAMSWSNIEDTEVVRSLNRRIRYRRFQSSAGDAVLDITS
jgi:hypothetical protein